MKKLMIAMLVAGLASSAYAQSPAPQTSQQSTPPPATTPSVPGAHTASTASLGDLTPFYVVAGAVAVGAIIVATNGNDKDKKSNTGTTGTTGTN